MKTFFPVLAICLLTFGTVFGQGGMGGGAGAGAAYNARSNSSPRFQFARSNSSQLVGVSGTAVLSVKPESIRLVFAVTAGEESSHACAASVKKTIAEIRKGSASIGVSTDNIVEDFINVEQQYKWELRKIRFKIEEEYENAKIERDDDDLAKLVQEKPNGFRMQTNLHVLCKDESQANEVMNVAFKAGVSDIIAFDYWHSKIDAYKKEALEKAVAEAKSKAEIVLAVFEEKPEVLNIENSATVSYPASLYKTLQLQFNDRPTIPYRWRDQSVIRVPRPKITFYEGFQGYSDLSPNRPAMHPEISVSATVTLTYGSPARDASLELERLKLMGKLEKNK